MKTQGSQFTNITMDDFRERIKIMYHTKKRNERGDIIDDKLQVRGICFAKVYPYMSKNTEGRELELSNEVNYKIIVRYRDDIKPDDFIIWRDKKLKMRSSPVDVENRHIYTSFEAVEMIGDGKA